MFQNLRAVSNGEDLISALAEVSIAVPERIMGRRTIHPEMWSICRLLATLVGDDLLEFPLSITHRDRPDFLLEAPNAKIGIEITESISEQYAEYCALAERECPNALLEPAHFGQAAPMRTTEELRDLLRQERLTSDGWAGNRPEIEWGEFIRDDVKRKIQKLTKLGFEKFDRNWLSIYDNLPFDSIDLDKAISFLYPGLNDCWSQTPGFNIVFIEHHDIILKVEREKITKLPIRNLWQ